MRNTSWYIFHVFLRISQNSNEKEKFSVGNDYKLIFKSFCRENISRTRTALKLTQAKMASILCMDIRSYAGIEGGENSCSGLTLALFLIYCCPDPQNFLNELRTAFEQAKRVA